MVRVSSEFYKRRSGRTVVNDILIIADGRNPDQRYATGLALHGVFLSLTRGTKVFVAAGGFEYPQARAKYPSALRFEDLAAGSKGMVSVVQAFCAKYCVSAPVVPRGVTAGAFSLIKKACPKARLAERGEELFPARAIKRAHEIRAIKAATTATEDAIIAVRDVLADARVKRGVAYAGAKPLTSEALKRVAAQTLAAHDASCPDMIISSGKQGALPHHTGSGLVKEGAVVVDIFPQSHESGYYSDMTRTFVIGNAPKTFDERYAAVIAVHAAARKAIKHGARDIEKVARDTFTACGMKTDLKKGTGYIHSLGHGVGLEIHEEPRLSGKLVAGNVITVEPGLYYDYGIRVEDIGLVTKKGFTNFSKLKKEPYL